jgi:hypothetical protein
VNWNETDNVKMFFSPAQPRHLFHIQGTYSHPASVVFSCNDYSPLAGQQINAPVIEPLQRLLQNYTVLFIGCGETTTDQQFSEVFKSLRSDSARSRHALSSSARGRHSRAPAPESDLNPSATRPAGAMTSRSSPSFSPGPRGLSRPWDNQALHSFSVSHRCHPRLHLGPCLTTPPRSVSGTMSLNLQCLPRQKG